MQTREYGAVFTQRWMVELMLDLVGYTADNDLAHLVAHEPSCGGGAFLVPMVERLVESCRRHKHDLRSAARSIAAWDLQPEHVHATRTALADLLAARGCTRALAERLARGWVSQEDYLLRPCGEREADFVIGNPPYIRSEALPHDLREQYLERCKTMTPGADIFVGFIERGLTSLREGGALCFICADRWMHNTYGKRLRGVVVRDFSVEAVLKMHGVDAFAAEVSAYPAVTIVRRGKQGQVLYAESASTFDESAARRLGKWAKASKNGLQDAEFSAAHLPTWFGTDGLWPAGSPKRLKVLEALEARLPLLEDTATGTKVGIGIATGADSVFITRDPHSVERERLLPLVLSDHLTTGSVEWSSTWLVNPWNSAGDVVSLAEWPKLSAYLAEHATSLRKRHVAKVSGSAWFRTIDKVRLGLAKQPKLLFQDMKRTSEPVLELGQLYPHHNLYWITSEKWDLRVLGGLLLSRVAQMFIEAYAVRMRGGTLRFQAQYLRKVRVPALVDVPPELRRRLAGAFDRRDVEAATSAALLAYNLRGIPS